MNAATLIVSIVAVLASIGAVITSIALWRRDKREREADRAERRAERNDVLLDVSLIELPPSGIRETPYADEWWRIRIVGGNSFSRATVRKFEFRRRTDGEWEPVEPMIEGVLIGAGQSLHLRAALALRDVNLRVRVEWAPGDEPLQIHEQSVWAQPG